MLTAHQRYRQAVTKARLLDRREMRNFLAGRSEWLESSMDRERALLIEEIERAYQAGRRDAAAESFNKDK